MNVIEIRLKPTQKNTSNIIVTVSHATYATICSDM